MVIGSVLPAATAADGEDPPPPAQPDIVVVMVDDFDATDERVVGRLPNISALFRDQGLRFTSFFNESPLCCPGRAAFLTGQHTRNHGVRNNNRASALDSTHTLATALDAAGYWTVHIGKYLNNQLSIDPTPDGWDRVLMSNGNSTWQIQGADPITLGYHDREVLNFAVTEATDAPDGPLFMWLNPNSPHSITSKPREIWIPRVEAKYVGDPQCNDIPRWKPPDYNYWYIRKGMRMGMICRSLLTVDEMVGTLRTTMTEQGRDPIWIFMADNGMAWGRKGWGLKDVPEADRTPLYMAGPGITHGTTNALLPNIDLPLTLAELAGASMPWADGASFTGALDADGGGRDWLLEEHFCWRNQCVGQHWISVRQPDWRLIGRKKKGTWRYRLHYLPTDPWERVNVKDANPAKFNELLGLFPWPLN
jgi:arylsulfatase A-like enzyme